ncbi:MOSC domain-containing protein [Mycolicibacterium confluentis]|uniref:MOSC domain-containing protein n=1 Tax=Mycolicibacterium confluentis TaxID=28047 RepID=A0A7I7XUZ8_9MYCO|nr:MOSC domain-containing protein [Mycolicibacterium confluentis]
MLAVSVGRVQSLPWRGRVVSTAIAKASTSESVWVGRLGLAGDEQGDREHHGGLDKAVMAYSGEHYPAWSDALGPVSYPAFGENLTTFGLLESDAVIGAVYQVGTVLLQVTQPRRPCYKLSAFHGIDKRAGDVAVEVQRSGRTGMYFRVLGPGRLRAGDRLHLLSRPRHGITAAEVHRVLNIDRTDRAGAGRLLEHPDVLPAAWRALLHRRLAGEHEEQAARLYGTTTATTPSVTTKESS